MGQSRGSASGRPGADRCRSRCNRFSGGRHPSSSKRLIPSSVPGERGRVLLALEVDVSLQINDHLIEIANKELLLVTVLERYLKPISDAHLLRI
jgi:hypothetical protein